MKCPKCGGSKFYLMADVKVIMCAIDVGKVDDECVYLKMEDIDINPADFELDDNVFLDHDDALTCENCGVMAKESERVKIGNRQLDTHQD